ncbi:MAG: ABC transporter permease [Anaerolineae bacterium]|nr:ABC transporter permease [Anaerolineae bacterium]NUQ03177.1 ABC transporter permease [Anaerolineae bacterium]
MLVFILRRLLLAVPVLFGIIFITFALQRFIPGDPCRAVLGERATDEVCDDFIERMGLNEPLTTQFSIYLGNILRGDFGTSIRYGRTIVDLMAERLPVTIELGLAAMLFAIFVGIPLGIISAYFRNSAIDVGTMIGANIGVSMPVFWLGLMLAYIFSVLLKDTFLALPPSGRLPPGFEAVPFFVQWGLSPDVNSASPLLIFLSRLNLLNAILTLNGSLFITAIRYLILPAFAVGTIPLAIIARMTRSSVLETLGQDYVRTARSKGLREVFVVINHAVRNALLPVVTIIGLNFSLLISGAVLTETVFGLTGVGRTLVDGITTRDYTLVQGFTIIIASAFVLINLFVDILYGYLDPRIRLS